MIWEDYLLVAIAIVIVLVVVFAPTPGIDCSHYHEKTFRGITVNCNRQAVRK